MTDRSAPDDQVVAVLERTLATYADHAPPAVGLPERVRRTRRRRTLVQVGVGTGAALAAAAAIVLPMALGGAGSGSVNPAVESADVGWRWESYRGLELQVPADWGYGTSQQPWCLADDSVATQPYVGRPGVTAMIACEGEVAPVGQRVPFVWFGIAAFEEQDLGDGWVVGSAGVGDAGFTLLTDDPAIRDHIIESARLVDTDANGCAVDHPIAKDPDLGPATAGGLPSAGEVTGASVCQYTLSMVDTISDGPSLLASRRVDASNASALTGAIAEGPEIASRPPVETCSFLPAYGSDVVLVRLDTTDGIREVVIRTNGCALGTDDGVTERELTESVKGVVLEGPLVDGAGLSAW